MDLGWEVLTHHTHSLDLAPSNFICIFLFFFIEFLANLQPNDIDRAFKQWLAETGRYIFIHQRNKSTYRAV